MQTFKIDLQICYSRVCCLAIGMVHYILSISVNITFRYIAVVGAKRLHRISIASHIIISNIYAYMGTCDVTDAIIKIMQL